MGAHETLLKALADSPEDFTQERGTIILVRQGKEHLLSLKHLPAAGVCVQGPAEPSTGTHSYTPVDEYIQKEILGLPRLASQLVRSLEKSFTARPARFVEGAADFSADGRSEAWPSASKDFARYLAEREPGATRLLQVMAAAGSGKTVLLEQTALESARSYRPTPHPIPILIPVDLLGRYVGTIDDAIAGSLNNTFMFPGLTQRDVVLCIREGWLALALDGFDELVARIGPRDAFLRVSDLLDQVSGSGTIILSARESFFELYQISAAVRSYLQPRVGLYSTSVLRLRKWEDAQGIDVFRAVGSSCPDADYHKLLHTFENDKSIVLHPFFLTRLADLWMRGERFADVASSREPHSRTKYIIETFVQREAKEKWVDRKLGTPMLTAEAHTWMLAGIAEEMWRASAFRLGLDELKLAAEIALSGRGIPIAQLEGVLDRLPTHAAFVARDRNYTFVHDQFLHYYLGYRLAELIHAQDIALLPALLSLRELGPGISAWIAWNLKSRALRETDLVRFLNTVVSTHADSTLRGNIGRLCASLLDRILPPTRTAIANHTFAGDCFLAGNYHNLEFTACQFWQSDFSNAHFVECSFIGCTFSELRISASSTLQKCLFERCEFALLDVDGEGSRYAPSEVASELRRIGANVVNLTSGNAGNQAGSKILPEARHCIERYVKLSERTCDVAVEDIEDKFGRLAKSIAKLGVEAGIMRDVERHTSGPRKKFVRFKVDRAKLLRGQVSATGDSPIDQFWALLAKKHPSIGE